MEAHCSRRTYDYRIREAICESGDRDLFPELEIPRSTIRSWIHRGLPDVVTSDLVARDRADLLAEIRQYQHRAALLGAVVGLLIAMLRISKVQLDYERLPDGDAKRILLPGTSESIRRAPPEDQPLRAFRPSGRRRATREVAVAIGTANHGGRER